VRPGSHRGAIKLKPVDAHQIDQRQLQLIDQLHDVADDLSAQILVALREQNVGQSRADGLSYGSGSAAESADIGAEVGQSLQSLRPLHDGIDQRAALIDQIHRVMGGIVGELQHVRERWRASGTWRSAISASRDSARKRSSAACRSRAPCARSS